MQCMTPRWRTAANMSAYLSETGYDEIWYTESVTLPYLTLPSGGCRQYRRLQGTFRL